MTSKPHRVAVVGLGYWGPNLLRNFVMNPRFQVAWAADLSGPALAKAVRPYPGVQVTADVGEILRDTSVDLVAIATPVATHHRLGMDVLAAGKHVLMTKPLTATSAQAAELVVEAQRRGRRLFVDHTFIFTPAVRKIRDLVAAGELGEIYFVDSVRINLGLFQSDVNVVWDLAPHDLSILLHVLGRSPTAVVAAGIAHTPSGLADIAYLTLRFGDALIANLHLSWLSPVKVRHMIFGGSKKSLIFNDLEPSEKIRVYDRGISLNAAPDSHRLRVEYRLGDAHLPSLPTHEALALETENIADALDGKREPECDGRSGLTVVRILEAAQRSLDSGFQVVPIDGI